MRRREPVIERVKVKAYRIPTDQPESDGTCAWDSTTMVTAHIHSEGMAGFGYTYADAAAAQLAREKLSDVIMGMNPCNVCGCRSAMLTAVRNLGQDGIAMLAISALDTALWDLKAKLLEVPLAELLGAVRYHVPVYGSGGFTSYDIGTLQRQLGDWVEQGIPMVKMKIGSDPEQDPERVIRAREAIGSAALFVDANGAYSAKQALSMAHVFTPANVTWFEEPVVHTDLQGLRRLRTQAPAAMEIAAGEYGFTLEYFQRLAQEETVDVLQADVTRCGISGFMQAAVLCEAHHLPLSAHCAPALHIHPCCAALPLRHLEYFHDHVRIERMLLDGVMEPVDGMLAPDLNRPGHGLELREKEAGRFEI